MAKNSPVATAAKNSAVVPPAASIREIKPASDDIRRRAYELYCQRNAKGTRGTPEEDWAHAERDLLKK